MPPCGFLASQHIVWAAARCYALRAAGVTMQQVVGNGSDMQLPFSAPQGYQCSAAPRRVLCLCAGQLVQTVPAHSKARSHQLRGLRKVQANLARSTSSRAATQASNGTDEGSLQLRSCIARSLIH